MTVAVTGINAVVDPDTGYAVTFTVQGPALATRGIAVAFGDGHHATLKPGTATVDHNYAKAGTYEVQAMASGYQFRRTVTTTADMAVSRNEVG